MEEEKYWNSGAARYFHIPKKESLLFFSHCFYRMAFRILCRRESIKRLE